MREPANVIVFLHFVYVSFDPIKIHWIFLIQIRKIKDIVPQIVIFLNMPMETTGFRCFFLKVISSNITDETLTFLILLFFLCSLAHFTKSINDDTSNKFEHYDKEKETSYDIKDESVEVKGFSVHFNLVIHLAAYADISLKRYLNTQDKARFQRDTLIFHFL